MTLLLNTESDRNELVRLILKQEISTDQFEAAIGTNSEERHIEAIRFFRSGEVASLEMTSFFPIQIFFCAALKYLDPPIGEVVQTVNFLVNKGGDDFASNGPNRAFRDWCSTTCARVDAALLYIEDDPDAEFQITTFVLEAGSKFDCAQFVRKSIKFLDSPNDQLHLSAATALGRIEPTDDAETVLIVSELAQKILTTDDENFQTNCLLAVFAQHRRKPELLSEAIIDVISQVDSDKAGIRYALANAFDENFVHLPPESISIFFDAFTKVRADENLHA